MYKDLDKWNTQKKLINQKEFKGSIKEREIWWCSIGLNIGDEQDGKNDKYERPILIIKKFNSRFVLALPITSKAKKNKYYFAFNHGVNRYAVILSQIRPISTRRLTRMIRKIPKNLFFKIKKKIIKKLLKNDSHPVTGGISVA